MSSNSRYNLGSYFSHGKNLKFWKDIKSCLIHFVKKVLEIMDYMMTEMINLIIFYIVI